MHSQKVRYESALIFVNIVNYFYIEADGIIIFHRVLIIL